LLFIDNIKSGNVLIRSTPNPTGIGPFTPEERRDFAIEITSEAIGATIRYLQNSGYEILFQNYNKEYPTVFKVKHCDKVFDLVVRPCHYNKYKIHLHEKDVLKNEDSELWLSDGKTVTKETLYNLMFRIFDSGSMFIPTTPFVPGRQLV
jgi:hypothetical protein